MNLVQICSAIESGYGSGKSGLDDGMLDLLIQLSDRAGEVRKLVSCLVEQTPPMPPADAPCHVGLVTQDRCVHCSRIARSWAAIHKAIGAAS